MKGRSANPASRVANAINALEKALIAEVKKTGKSLSAKDIQVVVRKFKSRPSSSAPQGAPASPGFTQLLIAPFADVIDAFLEAVVENLDNIHERLPSASFVFCDGWSRILSGHSKADFYDIALPY